MSAHPPILYLPFTSFYSCGGDTFTPILRLPDRIIQHSRYIIFEYAVNSKKVLTSKIVPSCNT